MRKSLLLFTAVLFAFTAFSQDFSNKGKDFWVAYGYHTSMIPANGNSQNMVLYFATDQVTNITINIPGNGYTQTITTPAGNSVITSAIIPKTGPQDSRVMVEGLSNLGIHITSDKPMVAYAHIYNGNCSGATILYPTNTLGKEYYSVNYKNWSNQNNANCFFYVVATDTGTTTVQITPSANTTGGWVANTTYTVNLTQGQVYNVMGVLTGGTNPYTGVDLTGSLVKSISSGNGGCKRIGVFSGSGRISITCNNQSSSSDNYMVQAMPKTAWGKKYLTTTAAGNQTNNIFRVCVSNPTAVVKINGVVTALPLQNNFYYEIAATNQPQKIESDSAIMVSQYFTSQGACGNGASPGDPEVIYLSAVEQNINTVLWNATPNFQITQHYFNVVLPNTGTAITSFKLDGVSVSPLLFQVHPQDPNYSYLKQSVTVGFHIIQSDSGFNAIAYGFGNAESYGFNAGTNIKDLYQQIGVSSTYGIETTPSVCTNSPFKFKVSLPYIPDSMYWNFHSMAGMMPNSTNVMVTNVVADSITVVNGKNIYWYSLPTLYSITGIGSFPVTITTYAPNSGGCGSVQDIDFTLVVTSPPVADFTWVSGGCVAEPFQFLETTPQIPKPTYHFWWDFGDPASGVNNNSGSRNPTHTFSAPGNYTVRFSDITTPGCLSDTIVHQVTVAPLPNATISGNATVCINDPQPSIIFTGTGGTPEYTFSYNIDNGGGPGPTLTVNSTGGIATIPAPTLVAGTYIYTLLSVKNIGSALCTQNISGQQATVVVRPNATIGLSSAPGTDNQTVCINNPIVTITYSIGGSGNGASITAGGLPAGVTANYNAGVFTILGTPTVSGVFNYTVTTSGPCGNVSLSGTITVNANSTITLSSGPGTDAQTVCINNPIVTITYAIGAGGTGASITAGSLPAGVTGSFAGGVFTILGTPTVSGVFNYTVTTLGPCINNSMSGTITVNANSTISLSSAAGTDAQTVCINNPIINITYAIGAGGTGASITAGALPAGVTGSYNAGVFTILGIPTVSGVFNYTVTTSGPCINNSMSGSITVNANSTITLSSGPGTDAQTVCINNPIVTITYSIGAGGTGASITAGSLPAGVTGSFAGGVFTILGTPTVSGVFNYTVTTLGPCINNSMSGSITVNANSTISLSSAAGTDAQTVCINHAIVNITYAIGSGGTGASITAGALPAGVTGSYAGGVFTILGTPTVSGIFNYTVTTNGPCINPSLSGTITVTANSLLTLSSAPGTDNQSVCKNSTITDITYSIAGTGTGASITAGGLPAGVTGTYNAGVFTITGTPTVSGIFNYTVTTSGPCVNPSLSGTITVYALPTPNFSFNTPSCETRTITFTDGSVANSGTLASWAWNFGDPTSGASNTSGLQNPTHTFATAGVYTVTLSVTSSHGCISNPIASIPVTINARPLAGFIIPEVCLSDTYAQFNDTSKVIPGTIVAWAWNFGDPGSGPLNTSTLQNPQHSYSAVGSYNVQLIVTSATGCKDTIVQVLTVNGSFPVANFSVNNAAALCANDSVSIVNSSTVFPGVITKVEIYWDNIGQPAVFQLDDFPYFGKVYSHLYPNFQTPLTRPFTIRFRAYSGGVCVNDKFQVITVNAAPKVQFNPLPNSCLNIPPFQITQASETGGVPGSYVFTGPGVSPTGMFNPAAVGPGTYTIKYTYTSTAGGCVDSASQPITVLVPPVANFSFSTPDCETSAVTFTDASTNTVGSLTTWTWDFGDGTGLVIRNNAAAFTHIFAAAGTYNVKLFVTTSDGCNSLIKQLSVLVNPQPRPNFTFPGSVCLPFVTVPFTNTSTIASGTIVSWLWDFGDPASGAANTSTLPNPTHVYSGVGPFNVKLQGTSAAGCVHDTTIVMNGIHPQPIANFSANKTSVCIGETVSFTDQSNGLDGTVNQWHWDFGDAATSIQQNPLHAYATNNSYTVKLFIINSHGCNSDTAAKVITVLAPPVADFSFSAPDCETKAVTFTDASNAPVGSITTWTWNFNDGSPVVVNNNNNPFTHIFPVAGTYNVVLTVTTNNGCSSTPKITAVAIHPQPRPNFSFDKPAYCIPNALVTFNNLSSIADGTQNAFTYLWNFGDAASGINNTSVAKTPSHFYATMGAYQVKLQVTSGNNCVQDTTIVLNTIHPQPKAGFNSNKPSICIADDVTFSDNSLGMDGIVTQWHWDFGDGQTSNTNPVTHIYISTDTFNVSLYVINSIGCNSDTLVKPFAVYAYPTIDPMPDRFILEGGAIVLQPVVSGQNLKFLWTPNLYLSDNKIQTPTVSKPLDDITYKLTVTGIGGCAISKMEFVKLLRFPRIPNTFTPNNDGINDTWRIDYLNTYPNNRVQVFTRTGQLVFESHGYNTPWDGTFKGKPLPLDTYYYIIEPGNGRDPITGYVTIIK